MRDVARLAGVSQRTVSNVVNDYVHVKPETRQRVQSAIEALRYRPNINAQKLRSGKTGIIALAVPYITAPYFAELADRVQQSAEELGLTVLIDQTGGLKGRELRVLDGYRSNLIDGLILSALAVTAEDLSARKLDFPVVLLGEQLDNSGFLHVSINNVAAARTATDHLISLGRRRIAAVGAPAPRTIRAAIGRMQGYTESLRLAGLKPDPDLIRPTSDWTRAEGYAIGLDLVDQVPDLDGIFCFNDLLAIGVLKALVDRGVNVPGKVAVVGWDDIEDASYTTPTLTTIAPNTREVARTAVHGLQERISNNSSEVQEIICGYELRVRNSTASALSADEIHLIPKNRAAQTS